MKNFYLLYVLGSLLIILSILRGKPPLDLTGLLLVCFLALCGYIIFSLTVVFHRKALSLKNPDFYDDKTFKNPKINLIFGIYLIIIGLCIQGYAVYSFYERMSLSQNGEKTTAIVISHTPSYYSENYDFIPNGYINVFSFNYTDGSKLRSEETMSFPTNPPTHFVGESVTIAYDKEDTSRVIVPDNYSNYFVNFITFLVGLSLLFIGKFGHLFLYNRSKLY